MKIALFTDTYLPQLNGVAIYLSDAVRELSKEHEVLLFFPAEGGFAVEDVLPNLRIYRMPSLSFPFYEGYRVARMEYPRICHILEKEKPDIVHAHAPINLGFQGLMAAKRKKIPCMITYHTHFPDYVPHLLKVKLPGLLKGASDFTVKKMIKHSFKMADAVAAPTYELVEELRSYGLRNVVYLPNGIDFSKFRCTKRQAESFRKRHRIPKTKKVVLYLGRISFEKKLDALLQAFSRIKRTDAVLVLAGGGPGLESLRDFAKRLKTRNVIFTGFVRNPAHAYACADLFVSPSDTETFGLTFIEAMYWGLPVIGVRKFGAKEVINDMRNGLLVEPGDGPGLAKAMETLIGQKKLRTAMGLEGKETAKGYSIRNSIEKTLDIYQDLLSAR